jgi:CRISPR-associated protein Cas1
MTEKHILERMVKDIRWLFQAEDEKKEDAVEAVYLWDDKEGTVRNGCSYGQEEWE